MADTPLSKRENHLPNHAFRNAGGASSVMPLSCYTLSVFLKSNSPARAYTYSRFLVLIFVFKVILIMPFQDMFYLIKIEINGWKWGALPLQSERKLRNSAQKRKLSCSFFLSFLHSLLPWLRALSWAAPTRPSVSTRGPPYLSHHHQNAGRRFLSSLSFRNGQIIKQPLWRTERAQWSQ